MPQVIGLWFLFLLSFCLHGLYRSFRVLVPILPRHFPQDFFRFFDSASGRKPTRGLGNEPRKEKQTNKQTNKQQENQKLIEFSSVFEEQLLRNLYSWTTPGGHLFYNTTT